MLTVGAGFAPGVSMTLEPEDGQKISPAFAWRLTADATYPLSPTVAAMLSFGLDSRASAVFPNDHSEDKATTHISYFVLNPAFKFSVFSIGLNLGFPLSASTTFHDVSVDANDATMDLVNTMVEPRIAFIIPLMDEEIGWLGLTIGAGITLDDYFKRPANSKANLQMVAAHLGLTWQFGIKGTGRR